MTRFYQPISFEINMEYSLNETNSHHAAHVLRMKVGDQLVLFNGSEDEYVAVITGITKKIVRIQIVTVVPAKTESSLDLSLAQGIARGEKMDWIVQKATELGVKKIYPLLTQHTTMRIQQERLEKRMAHWQAIAISACEQSGRTRVPSIHLPMTLPEWLDQISADRIYIFSPEAKEKLSPNLPVDCHRIALLIGPEGGLSQIEIKLAADRGGILLNLGPRILRTETASIAALSLLQFQFGDKPMH